MKLIECYIENFGKLNRFSYRFEDGLNAFCRDNGWGKSTFAGFIKAMLYGLTANRSTDVQQNERLRYLPWQGGKCGGTLTFSVGEETYRVERYFGNKESQDTFALYDCKTGLPSTAYSVKLGEELFDIDAGGYERTTFISEKLTSSERADYTGIQSKLVDMNDLSDFGIAEEKLEKRRKYYFVQGGRGAIAETSAKLAARRTELAEAEDALKKTNELNRRARVLDEERVSLEEQLRAVHSRLDASVSLREEQALSAHKGVLEDNLNKAKEETAACRAYLSANIPTPEALEEQGRNWRTLSDTTRPEPPPPPMAGWIPLVLYIVGGILLAAGFMLGIWAHPALFSLCVASLIAIEAGVICSYKRRRAREAEQIATASRTEYERLSTSLRNFLSSYPIVMADDTLHDDGERLWAIRGKVDELRRAITEETEAEDAYRTFRNNHPQLFSDTPQEQNNDLTEAKVAEEELMAKIDHVREERTACEREIARYASLAGRYSACAQEISNLEAQKRDQEKSLEIIQLTKQYLTSARTALTSRYLTDIQMNFREYMRILTEVDRESAFSDEYESDAYTVTPDFCVNITKFGKTRTTGVLSRGGRDLVALCLRFAITDALFTKHKPSLILDDPFINLDDGKTTAAMALLKRIAEERQIFYVSCHSSRA